MSTTRDPLLALAPPARRANTHPIHRGDDAVQIAGRGASPQQLPLIRRNNRVGDGRPEIWRADDLLALQRTVGNQATQRLLAGQHQRTRPYGAQAPLQREDMPPQERQQWVAARGKARWVAGAPQGGARKDRADAASKGLTLGATAVKTPADALAGFSFAGYKEKAADDTFFSKPTYSAQIGSPETRSGLYAGSQAVGAGSALLTMGSSIADIVSLSKKLKTAKGTKRAEIGFNLAGKSAQAIVGGGQAATGAVSSASGVAKLTTGNSVAGAVSTGAAGIGDALGIFGSAIEMVVTAGKGVIGVITMIQGKAADKTVTVADICSNFLTSGKNFLLMANSAISATSKFLTIAKTSADFVQVVPIIGGAINIAVQAIDMLVQTVKAVTQGIRLARAKRDQQRMKELANAHGGVRNPRDPSTMSGLASYLSEINLKRFKRGFIPLISNIANIIADLISVGGSVLNIVGAATAAAYGAGVAIMAAGYSMAATSGLLKLGAAALTPGAAAIRWSKQKIRDQGDKHTLVHNIGSKLKINMDKTTREKVRQRGAAADRLLEFITDLKGDQDAGFGGLSAEEQQTEIDKYTTAKMMVKATGLTPKELLDLADYHAMREKLMTAMAGRD